MEKIFEFFCKKLFLRYLIDTERIKNVESLQHIRITNYVWPININIQWYSNIPQPICERYKEEYEITDKMLPTLDFNTGSYDIDEQDFKEWLNKTFIYDYNKDGYSFLRNNGKYGRESKNWSKYKNGKEN